MPSTNAPRPYITIATKKMRIEVAYAKPSGQVVLKLDIADGTTAEAAIIESGILLRYPEIDLANNKVGIFGKLCKLDQALKAGDRVEISDDRQSCDRVMDPKEGRLRSVGGFRRTRAATHH